MKKNTCLFILLSFFSLYANAQKVIYISPTGSDANEGTKERPLASLTGARDAIREYKKSQGKSVSFTVSIADGVYTMQEPFVLTTEDGGTAEHPIAYVAEKGAKPVFSGGKKISGFKVLENGVWEAKIPESKYYKWRFDQLYINDKRAVLARTPNKGFIKIEGIEENVWTKGEGRSPERAQQILRFKEDVFKSLHNLSAADRELVRFRAYHKWDFTIRHVDKVDDRTMALYTSGKGMKPWNAIKKGDRLILENYEAALDTAGEWFLNKEGTLTYIPLPGQTPENTEVIAPVLENLISVRGDFANNNLVAHVTFEGIAFKHSHSNIPSSGFEPNQAATVIPAAIMLEGAKNITFTNCEIAEVGQHALWFGKGCSQSALRHSYLHNLGGGGVYIGDSAPQEGIAHTSHITLENNIIQSGGQEYPPAVGVWVGHSSDNEITHNDIGNFYYTGISVGWIWGYKPSNAKRNIITHNHIHHIGWDLLSDMAAVYTLGKSEGTVVSNNVIHHVHAFSYGGWGLYPDEGTSDIIMENNLVYSTKTGGFHQHYGENNTVRNNIFAYAKMYQAQCTRVEAHRSFNFTNNVVIFDKGAVLNGAWNKIDIYMDKNLYWNTGGDTYDFSGKSFKEWQQTGHDTNSLIADPNFRDAPNYDFTFKNKKTIGKIDFKPFDVSKAGVYGSADWLGKSKLPPSILEDFDKVVEENLKQE
ncbi:parallel beta helix pectate lyase-like protein [Dyadobacter jejuensis]|uniref:Parallel beta helix pectate lyase-like protein n=1 Tax=Dyadobacter jejuensis TaxID=1082580 RepID=A0A316AKF3_9BACT|nr:right-handed parallel beta-helix repeat-containing protein [Dyadobacter jejuensis]PWJ57982.1 parallel beta helix pectate lyase-like protein [Dyadobacter jejuensis]